MINLTDWLPTTRKEMDLRGWDCADVILFSGEIHLSIFPRYGQDLKLYLPEYNYKNTDDDPCQYAAVFVSSDFNDMIPQD